MSALVAPLVAAAARGSVEKAEALIDAARPRQALALAERALQRRPLEPDMEARLRLVRGQALWSSGGRSAASQELAKARRRAQSPAALAAVAQAAALFAWRDMDLAGAWRELDGSHADAAGFALRRAWLAALLRRDEGRFADALEQLGVALVLAGEDGHTEWRARVLAERAAVLTSVGRWGEARADALASRAAFHELGDPREITLAGLALSAIDVAAGDLGEARRGLERARSLLRSDRFDLRGPAEVLLRQADLELAGGAAEEAAVAAGEALTLFEAARDPRGLCWAHVRSANALLSCGRTEAALTEARRGAKAARSRETLLRAWAEVVLGRVLLRVDRQQAEPHFEAARAGAGERLDLVFLAQIGAALARGEGRDSRRLRGALDGLVAWGDRRLLALGLADVRDLISTPALAPTPFLGTAELAVASARERALVDVAVALSRPGDWAGRWADAMRALAPALPWKYAALVGPGALELRPELESPRRLEADGWLSSIAGRLSRPAHVELVGEPTESLRLLHGLHTVALAPLPGGGALCFGFTDGGEASARVALAAEVARLLASRLESRPELDSERDDPKPFPGIVGRCPAMQHLFAEMSLVAASEAFVHVGGETGSGKGRVAQALHERSRRRNGPFVAVNASSLSDELFEAEMFGHARGAFTGAVAAREGYVAAAEGGTLFLDEVSDLSPRGQAKLLRLLQEREYRRLGESEVRRANVRIISAANVDLEERVAKGAFRADLMYRLAVVILRLPPLRERGDDLLLLARHFLRAAAARDGREVPQLPGPVAQALCRHSWPGNVRELENEMSRLVALAGAGPILAGQLSPRVCGSRSPLASERLREALLAFERSFLKDALARHQGNRARTAGSIGITRQALLGKMARLGLT